jgi:hypothetical protein
VGDILICPKCQERLWVGEMQIPLVTCPKCLSPVVNPNAAQDVEFPQGGISRQVIPLESETSADVRDTTRWLIVLAIALVVMGIFIWMSVGINVLSILMIAGGVIMAGVILPLYRKMREVREPPAPYYQRVQRGNVTVLEYANLRQEADTGSFVSGFFAAIGICFLTMTAVGMGQNFGRTVSILAVAGGVAALTYLAQRYWGNPQKRNFFNGLVTGIILGAFGCGPCAVGAAFS